MTIIPGSAAPPEAEVQDLDYRRGNKWFPKAFGLWPVQGGALALLSWTVRLQRGWCILGADGKDGAKYCRPCGLVQCRIMLAAFPNGISCVLESFGLRERFARWDYDHEFSGLLLDNH